MDMSIWKVEQDDRNNSVMSILQLLLIEFERIFGEEVMNNEMCIVYNDSKADCPMLKIGCNPIEIRLSQEETSYWAQTIFQLSHELCHYAIRQSKKNKLFTLSWFEEIVCEAMSLYILKWSAENWNDCCKLEKKFDAQINDYLHKELAKRGNDNFQECNSLALLKKYDAEKDRVSHRNERNGLYYEIIKNPMLCSCFCDYEKYVKDDKVTIDFDRWEKNDDNPMIRFLHRLQPCIGFC